MGILEEFWDDMKRRDMVDTARELLGPSADYDKELARAMGIDLEESE